MCLIYHAIPKFILYFHCQHESFSYFTSSLAFGTVKLILLDNFYDIVVLILIFYNYIDHVIKYAFLGHLCFLFCEMPVHTFCPFFN